MLKKITPFLEYCPAINTFAVQILIKLVIHGIKTVRNSVHFNSHFV